MVSSKLVVAVLGMPITGSFGHYSSNPRSLISVSKRNDETSVGHKTRPALRYFEDNHGVSSEYIRIVAAHTNPDTGVSHVYARQTAGGVDVLDGVANVNIDKHGRIISSSQTFAPVHQVRRAMRASRHLAARSPSDSLEKALKTLCDRVKPDIDEALKMLSISVDESGQGQAPKFTIKSLSANLSVDGVATAQQSMIQGPDGTSIPVWDVFLQQSNHSWSTRINIVTGEIETLVDRRLRSYSSPGRRRAVQNDGPLTGGVLKKRLSYLVIPITKGDPRDGFDFSVNPETSSSPIGWVYTNTTSGNNVIAYWGGQEDVAKETSPDTFTYYHEETESPTTAQNIVAAMTNVFYVVNSLHDIFQIYGFTKVTYNFQEDNFGKGGQGNDRVLASVQDNSDYNNAEFVTLPDGQNGLLRVFSSDLTNTDRDSGLENNMIAHWTPNHLPVVAGITVTIVRKVPVLAKPVEL